MFDLIGPQFLGALIITRREVRDQLRDWRIIFPIIILTIFFFPKGIAAWLPSAPKSV